MKEWFHPEELKKSEENYRLNKVKPDVNNDFGSYKKSVRLRKRITIERTSF